MSAPTPHCGCGLWICRYCRPENFDPELKKNMTEGQARIEAVLAEWRRRGRAEVAG